MKIKLLFLAALLALFFVNATYSRNYPLTVAGIRITDTNCANITGTGISGSVSYSHATRTLTLNNATITHTQHIIEADSNLHVKLIGTNAIVNISGLGDALYAKGDSLVIEGPDGSSLRSVVFCSGMNSLNGTTMIVRGGCSLYAYGHYGITATGNRSGEVLVVDHSTVKACGATDYSIGGFASINLIQTTVTTPNGASYNTTMRRMVDGNSAVVSDTVLIEEYFPVRIGNTWFTKHNCDSLVCPAVTSGLVRYIDSTKTLHLRKATVSNYLSSYAIQCDSNITIFFEDTNTVSGTYGINLKGQKSFITSAPDALLSLMSPYYSIKSFNLTIQIPGYIYSEGSIYASSHYSYDTLTIIRSRLRVRGINNYSKVVLDECRIVQPSGARYDTTSRQLTSPQVIGYFVIDTTLPTEPPFVQYPFYVNGTRVTTDNASNVLNTTTFSNMVTYTPATNTLSFRNTDISNSFFPCIRCDSSVNIEFSGTNSLTNTQNGTYHYPAIMLNGENTTINGNTLHSVLKLTVQNAEALKTRYRLTISNITMTANGYGISRSTLWDDSTAGNLYLNNANVKIIAQYNSDLYISYFNDVVFTDCQIVSPADVSYSTNLHKMLHSNGAPMNYDTLVIAATGPVAIQPAMPSAVSIRPNPASQTISIHAAEPISQVEVYNAFGIKVKDLFADTDNVQLLVSDLANGSYVMKIHHNGTTTVKHFVVAH